MKSLVHPNLLNEIKKYGRFEAHLCYNCGTCTISCPIADDAASFPRRVIQLVQTGEKEKLISMLEPWICHWCGDCSSMCPQKAEPGESMNTLRKYLASSYDWTGISSLINKYWVFRIGFYLLSIFLVFGLFIYYHTEEIGIPLPDLFKMIPAEITDSNLEHVFGTTNIMFYFTYAVFLLPLIILITGGIRMWYFTMIRKSNLKIPFSFYLLELKNFFIFALTQKGFKECKEKKLWVRHLALFWGFVLISIIVFFFLQFFVTDKIYPVYHPQRWLGYIATILMFYGSIAIIWGRFTKKEEIHKRSDFPDWSLPILCFLVALSGILIHIFRYVKLEQASHYMFLAHILILAPLMLIELPFGKLAHLLYHPLGLYLKGVKERAINLKERGKKLHIENLIKIENEEVN